MSRSKRVRKARSAARREKRLSVRLDVARAHLTEAIERARFRRELNASDVPEVLKTVLGALVDPVGFVHEHMGTLMTRSPEEKFVELVEKSGRDRAAREAFLKSKEVFLNSKKEREP